MRNDVQVVLYNTKGHSFIVPGYLWDDGIVYAQNPKKMKYPHPGLVGTTASRDLSWVLDKNDLTNTAPSPFRFAYVMYTTKKPSKNTGRSRNKKTATLNVSAVTE